MAEDASKKLRFPGGHEVSGDALIALLKALVRDHAPSPPGSHAASQQAESTQDGAISGFSPCAVFDADGTLWPGDLAGAIVCEALARGAVRAEALERFNKLFAAYNEPLVATPSEALAHLRDAFMSGRLYNTGKARGWSPRQVEMDVWPSYNWIFGGWTEAALEALTEEVLTRSAVEVYPMREVLDILRAHGILTFVVSAGMEPTARIAAARFGFSPLEVRGQRSRLRNGVLCPEIEAPLMYGPGKLEVSLELCGGNPLLAFGDSVASADWEMMDSAYLAVAVLPKGPHRARALREGLVVLCAD